MKKILFTLIGLLILTGCDKEDPVVIEEEIQQNLAPADFALISPATGTDVDILDITFEWEPAVDPDGDSVTYDLYLSRNSSPPVRIAENLTETSYVMEGKFTFNTPYEWYVVARDGRQGEATSTERNFSTRNIQLEQILNNGSQFSFPRRFGYTGMYFNKNFYIINGFGEETLGDVWSSSIYGERWNLAGDLSDSRFERYAHSSVVFNDRMYVIGGFRDNQPLEDIYVSADGATWTEIAFPGTYGRRYEHSSVVFNDKIWVIGGYNGDMFLDDVMSWTGSPQDRWEVEAAGTRTPFDGIRGHSSVVFDNKMWVIGGADINDGLLHNVWSSRDGINWIPARDLPGSVSYHKSVVFDNKIWVIGGLTDSGASNEIYYYDKETGLWSNFDIPGELKALYNHSVVVVNDGGPDDGIYIFGSFDGTEYFNDVWKLY